MALIFFLSAQSGEVSGALSDQVADTVRRSGADALTPMWFNENVYANVRKWAHIYIYCALGFSMAITVHLFIKAESLARQTMLACGLCLLYAMTDEIHQYFVPGRAMLLGDVAVDAAGFLPCVAVVYLWLYLRRRKRV